MPCSDVIRPRRPFAKDSQLDYAVMEDEEWEPEPEGDSLSVRLLTQPVAMQLTIYRVLRKASSRLLVGQYQCRGWAVCSLLEKTFMAIGSISFLIVVLV